MPIFSSSSCVEQGFPLLEWHRHTHTHAHPKISVHIFFLPFASVYPSIGDLAKFKWTDRTIALDYLAIFMWCDLFIQYFHRMFSLFLLFFWHSLLLSPANFAVVCLLFGGQRGICGVLRHAAHTHAQNEQSTDQNSNGTSKIEEADMVSPWLVSSDVVTTSTKPKAPIRKTVITTQIWALGLGMALEERARARAFQAYIYFRCISESPHASSEISLQTLL